MRTTIGLWILCYIICLFSIHSMYSQKDNNPEKVEYKVYSGDMIKQLEYYAAAIKLCNDFDYKSVFGNRRFKPIGGGEYTEDGKRIESNIACIKAVPFPFVDPLEFYAHYFKKDKRILENQTNAFKLRSIRKELQNKHAFNFEKLLKSTNTEKLVSYDLINATIQDYNFDTGKLRLSYTIKKRLDISKDSHKITFPQLSERNQIFYSHYIDMSEDKAEKIYKHYANINSNSGNPPFNLNTKTTFAVRLPTDEKSKRQFQGIVKRIEFYIKNENRLDSKTKIGEMKFDQTILLNKYKRKYQKQIATQN